MKSLIPIMIAFCFGCFISKSFAQMTYDLKKIEQQIEKELGYKAVKNKTTTSYKRSLEWLINSEEISLSITTFETEENAKKQFQLMRMVLSNAQMQKKEAFGEECLIFGNYETNGGTLIMRKENLFFHVTADNLKITNSIVKIVLKTLVVQEIEVDYCKEKFYGIINSKTDNFFSKNGLLLETEWVELIDFIKCGKQLVKKEDKQAQQYLLQFLSKLYKEAQISSETYNVRSVFPLVFMIYKDLRPTKKAFDLGIKYANLDISYMDGHGYKENFGINFMQFILINMIHVSQIEKYQYEFYSIYLDENDFSRIYNQFYPILKADWEAGKIKLREHIKED